jgi:5-methylcytosine-specific restriction endonuclease McrA
MISKGFRIGNLYAAYEAVGALGPDDLDSEEGQGALDPLALHIRRFLCCLPSQYVKRDRARAFVEKAIEEVPEADFVALIEARAERFLTGRHLSLSEEDIKAIELRQNFRCAVCGTLINATANPHLDHVFPFVFGGADSTENLQLLCQRCNQGKGSLIHWVMAAPWFIKRDAALRAKLAYCVFSKYRGTCSEPGCENTSLNSQMRIVTKIPLSDGGETYFDNLRVVCETHNALLVRERERSNRSKLSPKRTLAVLRR